MYTNECQDAIRLQRRGLDAQALAEDCEVVATIGTRAAGYFTAVVHLRAMGALTENEK